ncbi:Dam family site-specific DNA-(adenine-N6)-methyltransferase [Effusibacillus lacus]|uniref:Site-specific DNA-methyltransferase (adenine-specific) n=1 Tax=Effusibacillus lacus TaxID=1348429 RepID=A0A292YQN2_9BACL|nr:Dam family site-specific DNA-(adenine-N6)-methyltransferase [Effusibacillus lacus]TCS75746.1 DNA adenine methylase [Effusibacillus lacus]GAX91063.1 DNA adenine methylase [Effusibacillus lacus]
MKTQIVQVASITPPKPVLKWAGGKQQMLDILLPNAPKKYNKYIEPFFGGGALFFALLPEKAIIADSNPEIINLYRCLSENVEDVISILKTMPYSKEDYYEIRATNPDTLTPMQQAARTIYLNKTCFNGLYRVNKKGQFNVPFGKQKNPNYCDEQNLRAASEALKNAEIVLGDYKDVLGRYAELGDLIFLDPPYLPISEYADFKRYTKEQFYEEDHHELAQEVKRLHELGCHVLLTNSNHPLVYELYDEFKISVYPTRRSINSKGSKRKGEDVLVKVEPKKQIFVVPEKIQLSPQVSLYPSTRYMGSKQNLLEYILGVAEQFKFETVLDLFSGSGVVSYLFKAHNKQVISNDYMAFSACITKALVENNNTTLNERDLAILLDTNVLTDNLVSETFKGLYFEDEDNQFIDIIRTNLSRLRDQYKRALAQASLVRACLKKRPRGIFTYTGYRYDDGRRDLTLSLKEQFLEAVEQMNLAVFDNGKANKSRHGDAMECKQKADLVYMDPPYFSPLSDNEYVRRYHFVEGLVRDWKGVEMQWHTKTKKFKSYPTPFSSRNGAYEAFDILFKRYKDSILIVSYSSNSLPTKDEMIGLMTKYKENVEVVAVDHRYSFGNQGHKVEDNNNLVKEYLFVGY